MRRKGHREFFQLRASISYLMLDYPTEDVKSVPGTAGQMGLPELLNCQEEERRKCSEAVIRSSARYKLIIAGPGTGKTFAFQGVCRASSGDNLAITFINNLADALAQKLEGTAKSQTFHSYCKGLLHRLPADGISTNFHYFPQLPKVIGLDAGILGQQVGNFSEAFQRLIEGDGRINFYIRRADYYDAVGHDDAVYRALIYLRSHEDDVEVFDQIVVDEYQDFNALEIALIQQLEKRSPVLIVGDDDQALYEGLKHASVEYIRQKAEDARYERFRLPFSSRCTEVVVGALHDVVEEAVKFGRLKDRIKRDYECYLPAKLKDSKAYPKIIHASCTIQGSQPGRNYVGRYIEAVIGEIPDVEVSEAKASERPLALIVGPGHYLRAIHNYLKDRIDNIAYPESKRTALGIEDGYEILLKDGQSNLGWRVVLEVSDNDLAKRCVISAEGKAGRIVDELPARFKKDHLEILEVLRRLQAGQDFSQDDDDILKCRLPKDYQRLLERFRLDEEGRPKGVPEVPKVQFATCSGSKGLQASFVFVVGMNNGEFPKNPGNPTDHEIREFIVALTRTCKQCHLISNLSFEGPRIVGGRKKFQPHSSFITWIKAGRVESIKVDKEYMKALGKVQPPRSGTTRNGTAEGLMGTKEGH